MPPAGASESNIAAIYALTQYARTADLARECMAAAMGEAPGPVPLRHLFVGRNCDDVSDQFLHMRLWFAFTYVVIEGWRELALQDGAVSDAIRELEDRGELDMLRRLRNAVFHVQVDPHTTKLTALIPALNAGLMQRLMSLDVAVQTYFVHWRSKADLSSLADVPVDPL